MKTILLLLCSYSLTFVANAQDPDQRLFDTQWFLTQLNVNGNVIQIPNNSEIDSVELFLEETGIGAFACNEIFSIITNFSDNSITASDWSILTNTCLQQNTLDFEEFYFNEMYRFGEVNVNFSYALEEVGNEGLRLTIINSEGDMAVYGNPALSVQDMRVNPLALFPVPMNNSFSIQLRDRTLLQDIRIFNLQGLKVYQRLSVHSQEFLIDVSNLSAGYYLVSIIDVEGQQYIKQVVKE